MANYIKGTPNPARFGDTVTVRVRWFDSSHDDADSITAALRKDFDVIKNISCSFVGYENDDGKYKVWQGILSTYGLSHGNYDLRYGSLREDITLKSPIPNAPGTIYVPELKELFHSKITWGESESSGDVVTYILERSINGGSFTESYRGAANEFTDTPQAAWNTVTYRVCAENSYADRSNYTTSAEVTVIHNSQPSAPSTITVPEEIRGGEDTSIIWSAATDLDGNLDGYIVEFVKGLAG